MIFPRWLYSPDRFGATMDRLFSQGARLVHR
ncbi:hypothetical protein LMG28688_04634 [Paraburkholderia caffeinitolerans]|uniref:Uncharacterized protein n=1 Tax=Paraburkholderia caffeinitolerans TaxID=1723730 RepID=A0A6J5GFK1_9BURK|nr:hypothetical protein LMG28688_04634 [Paraburkholderia caffeinitolerans]